MFCYSACYKSALLGTFSKARRGRQRGRGKAKELMGRTIASTCVNFVHLKPSSAKQQREIARICVSRTETETAIFLNFHLELNTAYVSYAEVKVWHRKRR